MEIEHAIINEDFYVIKSWSKRPSHKCNIHYHDHYELYYLLSGQREYLIDNKIINIYPKSIVLIKPGIVHQTFGSQFERLLINFNSKALNTVFNQNLVSNILDNMPDFIVSTATNEINNFFTELYNAYSTNNLISSAIYAVQILMFIKENQNNISTINPSQDSDLLTQIKFYINQNYKNLNTLEEIAEKFYISKYHLSHLFHKKLETTVINYLNNRKLAAAANLLRTTELPITEIAIESGFNTPAYLFKLFKKANGIAPLKYRKKFSLKN